MYSQGYNLLFAYVYIREKLQINNFNDADYYSNTLRWQDSNQPRHRITAAGTWDLPFGKGRPLLGNAVEGSGCGRRRMESLRACGTYLNGAFIRFGNLIANGSPCLDNPTPERWFDTSVFSRLPANTYVIRNNPMQYDCLTGPRFSQLDATLTKDFAVTERVRVELKMAAYNATNRLNRGGPNTDVNSSPVWAGFVPGYSGVQFWRTNARARKHYRQTS